MEYLKVWVDFREVIEPLEDDEKGRLFDAMLQYADNGEEPQFKGNERFVWAFARQSIDRTREKSKILSENGSKGGRPKKQEEATESKQKQPEAEKPKQARFIPPTVDQVSDYCKEIGSRVDAQRFVNFYESKGWKVGNQPMKNWKAAVRTWEQKDRQTANTKVVAAQQYQQRSYNNAEESPDEMMERLGG